MFSYLFIKLQKNIRLKKKIIQPCIGFISLRAKHSKELRNISWNCAFLFSAPAASFTFIPQFVKPHGSPSPGCGSLGTLALCCIVFRSSRQLQPVCSLPHRGKGILCTVSPPGTALVSAFQRPKFLAPQLLDIEMNWRRRKALTSENVVFGREGGSYLGICR